MAAERSSRLPSLQTGYSLRMSNPPLTEASEAFINVDRCSALILARMTKYANFELKDKWQTRIMLSSIGVIYYHRDKFRVFPPKHYAEVTGISPAFMDFVIEYAPRDSELYVLTRRVARLWRAEKRRQQHTLGQGRTGAAAGPQVGWDSSRTRFMGGGSRSK
jgi:hypothetical protein